MSTERRHITVSDIPVEIVRKDIKNLHLAVYPPQGRVRIAVPLHVDDDAARLAVATRLGWIQRQQARFEDQDRQSEREMVTGESHYLHGRRYRLQVIQRLGPGEIRLVNSSILEVGVRPGADRDRSWALLEEWYRGQLRERTAELITKWEPLIGVDVSAWGIRKMKTRWGSCNTTARRIWLNLELVKKPLPCLEYVVVHEMVHLLERRHNDRFRAYMDAFLPQWRLLRDELNRAPLADEVQLV